MKLSLISLKFANSRKTILRKPHPLELIPDSLLETNKKLYGY